MNIVRIVVDVFGSKFILNHLALFPYFTSLKKRLKNQFGFQEQSEVKQGKMAIKISP